MDFRFDSNADGSRLKSLQEIDVYSRLCLAINVRRGGKQEDVLAAMENLQACTQHQQSSAATKVPSSFHTHSELDAKQRHSHGKHQAKVIVAESFAKFREESSKLN